MKNIFVKYSPISAIISAIFVMQLLGYSVAQASMEEALFAARNRNFTQAFKLFLTEAELGNARAQYHVASMYNAGNGIVKNKKLAIEWFQKSAELGYKKSQKKLVRIQSLSENYNFSQQTMLKAVRKGDLAAVRALIKNKAPLNVQDQSGITALMEAVMRDYSAITEILLKNEADTNIVNNSGDTALLIAVSMNHLECAELLIKYGADVNFQDNNKSSPLIFATIRENLPLAALLLKHNSDIYLKSKDGRTAFDIAFSTNNEKLIKLFKHAGGKNLSKLMKDKQSKQNNHYLGSDALNKRGWSPAMYASWRGDISALKATINKSSDLNLKDSSGMTALALASQGGHLVAVKTLINSGAKLSCGNDPLNPIILATKQGHSDVVKYLIPALKDSPSCMPLLEETLSQSLLLGKLEIADLFFKNDISISHKISNSPLILMASRADNTLIDKLIKNGANVNGTNGAGETALMIAARAGNEAGLQSLLSHGADINKADQLNRTALIQAAQNNQILCVRYLVEQGADAFLSTTENNSALMLAAERGYISVVGFLVAYDNIDQKNNIGDTALIMAARNGFYDVVEQLFKKDANPRILNNKREKAKSVVKGNDKKLIALIDEYSSSRSWLQDIF